MIGTSGIRIRFPGLKVKILSFQTGDTGLKSRGNYGGHRTTAVQQIVALQMGVTPPPRPLHG